MTDITELAQSLKAAAEKWQEAWGKYDKVEITIAEFIRAANQYESIVKDPANVIELVEALEKAHAENTAGVAGIAESYETTISMLKSRIAELESRTVTVKFPHQTDFDDPLSAYEAIEKCKEALTAAGIKWEAE